MNYCDEKVGHYDVSMDHFDKEKDRGLLWYGGEQCEAFFYGSADHCDKGRAVDHCDNTEDH